METRLAAWGGTSRTHDIDGPVHYADFGGPADGPAVVLVHGLGGSHLDWCLVARRLAERARVTAIDLVGFGLTPPAGRSGSVQANAALLDRFVREVVGAPAVLVGNSMGGMISLLTAAGRPATVSGVVSVDAAVPMERTLRIDPAVAIGFGVLAVPRLGELALTKRQERLTNARLVRETLALCCVDPSRIPADLVEAFVELRETRDEMPGLERTYAAAARSILVMLARERRYGRRLDAITQPVLLLNGERDRLVPVGGARRLHRRRPDWPLVTFPDVGHVPMLEVPDDVVPLVLDFLDRVGAVAGDPGHTGDSTVERPPARA